MAAASKQVDAAQKSGDADAKANAVGAMLGAALGLSGTVLLCVAEAAKAHSAPGAGSVRTTVLGVGLGLFFAALSVVVHVREVLAGAAAGLIPLAIGIGFFVDYNLQKRELSRFESARVEIAGFGRRGGFCCQEVVSVRGER